VVGLWVRGRAGRGSVVGRRRQRRAGQGGSHKVRVVAHQHVGPGAGRKGV